MPKNGTVKGWLLGFLAAILVALGSWSGATTVDLGERTAALVQEHKGFQSQLARIEEKLDRLLDQRTLRP